MVDIVDNGNRSFAGRIALLGIDQIGDLKVECKIRLIILWVNGIFWTIYSAA